MEAVCEVSRVNEYKEMLNKIFIKRFNIDYNKFDDESYYDKHFLGTDIRLNPTDLLYLLRDVEKEFGITISEQNLAQGKFSSFNSVIEILETQAD